MKHRIAELEGPLLDAAVAKAEGLDYRPRTRRAGKFPDLCIEGYAPSTNWHYGGPIIERERIIVAWAGDGSWFAGMSTEEGIDLGGDVMIRGSWSDGPTPLIAAMRAFVASKFGEEVEL